jgi:hypothetical protein
MSGSLLIKPFPDILNPLFLRVLRVRRILRILRVLRVATDAAETPNRLQPSVHGWGPDRWRTWCRTWSGAWSPAWSGTWSTVHLDAATLLYIWNFCVLLRLVLLRSSENLCPNAPLSLQLLWHRCWFCVLCISCSLCNLTRLLLCSRSLMAFLIKPKECLFRHFSTFFDI